MAIVDALIATPLLEEFEALQNVLGPSTRPPPKPNGINYWLWKLGSHRVVGSPVGGMGLAGSAAYFSDALREWSPAHVFLVGIAGGLQSPSKLPLGDVVVPDQIIGYEVNSVSGAGQAYEYRPTGSQPGFVLKNRAETFSLLPERKHWEQDCLDSDEARALQAAGQLNSPPKIHFKPMASGNSVVKSKSFGEALVKALHPKLCAVEMEAQGAFDALYRRDHHPKLLMVRGISDYADEGKEHLDSATQGLWRAYAAGNAARLVRALLALGEIPVSTRAVAVHLEHNRAPGQAFHARGLLSGGELQYLHFPRFLDRSAAGTPALQVRIEARKDGSLVLARKVACVLKRASTEEQLQPTDDSILIAASEEPYVADLFLIFSEPVDEVRVEVDDPFEKRHETWKVKDAL